MDYNLTRYLSNEEVIEIMYKSSSKGIQVTEDSDGNIAFSISERIQI